MVDKNKKISTRVASNMQEKRVAQKLNGKIQCNSGATKFSKGDVILPDIRMHVECKTSISPRLSVTIKKEWLEKQSQESFSMRCPYHALAFNFCFDDTKDYFVIDDRLMQILVDTLRKNNNDG